VRTKAIWRHIVLYTGRYLHIPVYGFRMDRGEANHQLEGSSGVNLTRTLFIAGLLATSHGVLANSFEFGGLNRATTLQDVAKRYPNSTISGAYVHVSSMDTHDHIFGIELFGPNLSNRLRINFGSPDHKYPPCEVVESSIVTKHGPPSEVREFREEATQNRYLAWQLELETVHLQCFRSSGNGKYSAEAIAVYPKKPKPAPSNPGVRQTPASGRR